MNGNIYSKVGEIENLEELEEFLRFLIENENLGDAEVNIIFVSDSEIRALNSKYRNIDKETDVLSFALEESEFIDPEHRVLGDIYISLSVAKKQCKEYNNDLKRELKFLIVHGFLHLLGYDHMNDEDYKKMFDRQELLLSESQKQKR